MNKTKQNKIGNDSKFAFLTLLNGIAKSGQTGLIFISNDNIGNRGTASIFFYLFINDISKLKVHRK